MQLLISHYPRGLPGVGLAALRLSVALGFVLLDPLAFLPLSREAAIFATGVIAILLAFGLATSWMAFACCLGVIAGFQQTAPDLAVFAQASFGLASIALLLVGPGSYSFDAMLFGRRVVRIPD